MIGNELCEVTTRIEAMSGRLEVIVGGWFLELGFGIALEVLASNCHVLSVSVMNWGW